MQIYEKVYLIGNGRIANDCMKILHRYRKDSFLIILEDEKFASSRKFCERNGISYLNINRNQIRDFFLSIRKKTLIISAHNGYVFPEEVVGKKNLTILNMHIALLPLYRGMNAPTWEIFEEQEYAGTTWHEIDVKIDTGGIIVQRTFPIGKDDTAMRILQKSFELGVKLLEENIDKFLAGEYEKKYPQLKTKLYLEKDLPNGGYMDWGWNLEKKYAFLRSMDYSGSDIMPLPRILMDGKDYEIWRYYLENRNEKENNVLSGDRNKIIYFENAEKCLICQLRETEEKIK